MTGGRGSWQNSLQSYQGRGFDLLVALTTATERLPWSSVTSNARDVRPSSRPRQQAGAFREGRIPQGTPVLIREAVEAEDARSPDSYFNKGGALCPNFM